MRDEGFVSVLIIGLILGIMICWAISLTIGGRLIKSDYRIEPEYEIHVVDGKTDTTFIYRKK